MAAYLRGLGVDKNLVVRTEPADGMLVYTLATPEADTDTLSLKDRKAYRIKDARLRLPAAGGRTRVVSTVSEKEILLALLQHGRLTNFSGAGCALDALRDHVRLRQHVVAWTDRLSWVWPDGGPANWNTRHWDKGTPRAKFRVDQALLDAFLNQGKYRIGCYAATKLSYAHAVLDYHVRVKKDAAKAALVRERLMHDGEPLDGVEPAAMWDFEQGFDPAARDVPGKLLGIRRGIAPDNFVPGDWVYLLNTDPASAAKTGYEGSNAVYLGRGRFVDYYNDHRHAYTYREKIDEVYQWRHGVFRRSRDADKVQALADEDFARLSKAPAEGGLLLDLRVVPYLFGYEDLPRLPTP
ncbi:hypothetical protein [Ramlibacter sp. 2FC]|uniref:hypothetical protein n=1 Tax=Ramlibacter sp. 2FC TaxID=2502188 RepID=UPI0010F8CBCC|nr:hypothetical protein [Ramlibacter sp. 2FC]